MYLYYSFNAINDTRSLYSLTMNLRATRVIYLPSDLRCFHDATDNILNVLYYLSNATGNRSTRLVSFDAIDDASCVFYIFSSDLIDVASRASYASLYLIQSTRVFYIIYLIRSRPRNSRILCYLFDLTTRPVSLLIFINYPR